MRRGYKTTEFWVVTLTILGLVLSSFAQANVLPTKYAALAAGIASAGYAIARGLAKLGKAA